MTSHHQFLLAQFKKASLKPENKISTKMGSANYSGSTRKTLYLKNGIKKQIIKDWAKQNHNLDYQELTQLLDELARGQYKEETTSLGLILSFFKHHKSQLELKKIDQWLGQLHGWEEIDNLCQSTFDEGDLLSRWPQWQKLIKNFNQSPNIAKRRASLVLLIKTLRTSQDERVVNLAFTNIDNLKHEKDILITKAISWLLREMTKLHRQEVANYLEKNQASLPKIAVRETRRKLEKGRK